MCRYLAIVGHAMAVETVPYLWIWLKFTIAEAVEFDYMVNS